MSLSVFCSLRRPRGSARTSNSQPSLFRDHPRSGRAGRTRLCQSLFPRRDPDPTVQPVAAGRTGESTIFPLRWLLRRCLGVAERGAGLPGDTWGAAGEDSSIHSSIQEQCSNMMLAVMSKLRRLFRSEVERGGGRLLPRRERHDKINLDGGG